MGKGLRHLGILLAIAAVAPACGGGGGGKTVPGTVTVTLTSAAVTSEDGGTKATFTVVLSKKPKKDVTIPVSSSNVNEGDVDKSSLTFTKLNWNIPQTVTVTGIDDLVDDGNVAYSIILGACVSADKAFNGVNPGDVALTNNDDDTAGFDFKNIVGKTTTESGGSTTFTVQLTSQPTSDVTLTLSSSNTLLGTVSPTTLTFTVATGGLNSWNAIHTVTITGVNDNPAVADGSHGYQIDFGAATGGGAGYAGVTPASIPVTNTDNDSPGITANPSAGLVTNESGTTDTFDVVLNTVPAGDVTILVTTSDTNAGLVSSTGSPTPSSNLTLTFTTADWNVIQTVTVTGVNDSALPVDNAAVAYTITLNPASIADAGYNALADINISASNGNDDTAKITVSPTSGPTTEAGGQATFTVQLDTVPTSPVVLTVTSNNTAEGTVDQATLTFLADITALNAQTVTLTGIPDSTIDGNIPYTITIHVDPATTDVKYSGMGDITVNAVNNDIDGPGFSLSANANSLATSENLTTDTFTVALTSIPSQPVTVNFVVTTNPGEADVTASILFAADNTALTPQTVTVTGKDDGIVDGTIAFTITGTAVSADTNYNTLTLSASGNNTDNDVAIPPGGGPWSKPGSTGIPAGAAGTWNSKASQEPSVIKFGVTDYRMWFEGSNSTGQKHEQIGYATSTDGLTWTINAAPVFSHTGVAGFDKNGAGDPSVYFDGATYHMWYAGRETAATKNKIGYATSTDGLSWSRQNGGNPVLQGTAATFDAVGVSGPMVVKDGATYHMYYTGLDATGASRIGHATSTDGVAWTKVGGIVLNVGTAGAFDAFAVKLCGALIDGSTIRMWYVGTDVSGPGGRQKIGFATAPLATPTAWTKFSGNPVLSTGAAAAFDERNLWSPWVIKDPDDGKFKMWYGGENNGGTIRIGYAEIP